MPNLKDAKTLGARKLPVGPADQFRKTKKKKLPAKSLSRPQTAKRSKDRQDSNPSTRTAPPPKRRRNPFNKAKWEKLKAKKKPPEPRHVHGKPKRYRRSIRLRFRARVAIFLGALCILVLERYFGFLFQLDDAMDVYNSQMGIDPWQVETPPWELVAPVQPIHNLTKSHPEPCPKGLRRMINVHDPRNHKARRIPMMVHQTSKTRCLTRNFERASRDWIFPRWSYYLHDDEAIERLLQIEFPEFPHLKLVMDKCILSLSSKIYLWQYLVLWMYGGLYVDLNLYPIRFNATTILETDDGLFFTEGGNKKLSTKFMAVSPRHPLIYYAIQQSLTSILRARDVGSLNPDQVFGEDNFHLALMSFTKSVNPPISTIDGIPKGMIQGYQRRSIRVLGTIDGPETYVSPVFLGGGKSSDYAKMGNRRKRDILSTESCFQRIWTS